MKSRPSQPKPEMELYNFTLGYNANMIQPQISNN